MTYDELLAITRRVHTGIPLSTWDVEEINGLLLLSFSVFGPNNDVPNDRNADQWWNGRQWYIAAYSTENQVVNTMLKAVLMYQEHELRERFRLDGKAIFHPRH